MEEIKNRMNMEEKVFSYIEKYNMIQTGSHVTAGISGGADSVCLLFLLKEYQKRKDFSLQAVHINHQIRGRRQKGMNFFPKTCVKSSGFPLKSMPILWRRLRQRRNCRWRRQGET